MREAKAKSSARELRVRQLPLIDGLEGLTHTAFKFAAVAATGKVAKLWGKWQNYGAGYRFLSLESSASWRLERSGREILIRNCFLTRSGKGG